MRKLSELVSGCLEQAKAKVASASDAIPPTQQSKVASAEVAKPELKIAAKVEDAAAAKTASARSTALEAVKLAESLEHLSMLFPKIAAEYSPVDHPGPAVLTSPSKGTTKDTSTKATSLSAQEAGSGGGSGSDMNIETNKKASYAAKAAQEILNAKIAQSNALLAVGRAADATKLANEARVEFEAAKKAGFEEDGDPPTKTPKGNPKTLETFVSGMTGAPGGVAPDNAGAASFTKRDGKKREIAPLSQHISEPAFSARSDRGLADNLEHTQGAKIASIIQIAAGRKAASARAAS